MNIPWSRQVLQGVAWEVLAVAALLLVLAWFARRRGAASQAKRLAISAGVATSVVVLVLGVAFTVARDLPSPPVPFTARFEQNPIPESAQSLARGGAVFQASCVVCHGPRGQGDGPAAFALTPRPVNLQLHVPQHADGEINYFISDGVSGTAMPAWKTQLSAEDRWSLVHYLRALARGET